MDSKNDQGPGLNNIPNPSELMRARHPDLFSDTRLDKSVSLPKAIFEYHLDTLTSRKQEYEFEHFCRKLAEKEICPNLRVQTGPTGGGDSKVDTETYPVAEEISERWWIGEPLAGAERWAFAFSAKKTWSSKVKKDVDNILSTEREYKRIYFFTNQFVSDKKRSEREDKLSEQAGLPVHIVDRAWIVEKVYDNNHLDMAISTLGIEGAGSERLRCTGPRDTEWLAELQELDEQVADATRYRGARYQLVEDCLRSAIIARGLERPRSEVESRFAQADRLANEMDYHHQRMRIAYNRAWTAHWWYEDYSAFNQFYDEVEQYLNGSDQASEVERLVNLWLLLPPSVAGGRISAQDAKIELRQQSLTAMLQAIADDPARPNNALQARTGLTLIKITEAISRDADAQLDACWAELAQIVSDSATLGSYPVERLATLVQELGQFIDNAAFDALYEKVVDAVRLRRSEGEAGEAYSERGSQKLQQDKPYEAIKWFGRAEELLQKDEYRADLVIALTGSSYAYERVGLLWAARNKILAAVDRSLAVFAEDGEIVPALLLTSQRLGWIELQLGRIPHLLMAMSLASFAARHLKFTAERQASIGEEVRMQEAVLGIHLLNIPFESLPAVSQLPDALERLGLTNARLALLFALGQKEIIYEEGYFAADKSWESLQILFEQWQDQPAANDIPPHPVLVDGPTSVLRSTILGSEIVIDTPNNPTSFGVAESLLGALESFLATSDEGDLFPHKERINIVLRASIELVGNPEIHFSDEDGTQAEIVHPDNLTFSTAKDALEFRHWLRDTVVSLFCRQFFIHDVEAWLSKVAGEERAFSRAFMLGDVLTIGQNVLGDKPQFHLVDWLEREDKVYEQLRIVPWRAAKTSEAPDRSGPWTPGSGQPPGNLIDRSGLKHTERRVMSPIDVALWNRAKWRGTIYGEQEGSPPFLGFMFENGDAGQAIFRAWLDRWGNEDADDSLRVAIIRGLSIKNPTHYAVTIGPNFDRLEKSNGKAILMVSRINRMEPTSSENLDRFVHNYQQFGGYLLMPAHMGPPPNFFFKFFLAMRKVHIRQAWQISENDPDMSVLQEDDDPIIPPMVLDPPVNRALARIRAFRQR